MTLTIGVIQFPGSNCERETKLALKRAQLNPVDIFWFESNKLAACDGFVIVGGFSYEDRGRSGVIAAHDPFMTTLTEQAKIGKPILGICNGAQILVESGLVPGCVDENNKLMPVIALAHNKRIKNGAVMGTGYYNQWIDIKSDDSPVLHVPIAHAEGRFLVPETLYQQLKKDNVETWHYQGENPNGSDHALAAVGNFSHHILAMMPHPERTMNGDFVFAKFFKKLNIKKTFQLKTNARCWITGPRDQGPGTPASLHQYIIQLNITDNEAISVQTALKQKGLNLQIKKYRQWILDIDKNELPIVENSFVLWNPQKESVTSWRPGFEIHSTRNNVFIAITNHDDALPLSKKQILRDRYHIKTLRDLHTAVIWSLQGTDADIQQALQSHIFANPVSQAMHVIKKSLYHGKVRDIYAESGNTLLIKATNRMTAFDRYLCDIPGKGDVLTQFSAWWFERTRHIVPNHFISLVDHNTMRVKKCRVLPIEVVVRGFLTGSTNTSIWTRYEKGERTFFETTLPDGLTKNTRLLSPIITPTTKSESHDEPLTPDNISDYVDIKLWEKIKTIALQLFSYGQSIAQQNGFILVDTKYEFGLDENNTLCLIDECHTPDSSRYWKNNETESFDKEVLRLWYREHCDPYRDKTLPKAPEALITLVSQRYQMLFKQFSQTPVGIL